MRGGGGTKKFGRGQRGWGQTFCQFWENHSPLVNIKKYHPLSFYFNVAVTKLQYGNYIVSLPGLFVNIDWIFADYKVLI